jgi:hypothetical protein
MNPFFLHLQDVYPEVAIDVDVPSGEDDVIKKSIGDDAGDGGGGSLAEPIAPNSIRSDALRQTNPSITDWVASPTPPVGRRRHTRLPPVPKWEHALTSSN